MSMLAPKLKLGVALGPSAFTEPQWEIHDRVRALSLENKLLIGFVSRKLRPRSQPCSVARRIEVPGAPRENVGQRARGGSLPSELRVVSR
jgi:hypothetical protein